MAKLNWAPRDRAQILLAGAISLGILLVILAVVLNTAIYTEAVASDTDSEYHERAAMVYVDSVQRGAGGIIASINNDSVTNATHDELSNALDEEIQHWQRITSSHEARDGVWTTTAVEDTTMATRIVQDDQGAFTNASGNERWTLTPAADDILAFRLNVNSDNLSQPPGGTCRASDECFQLIILKDGTESRLHLSNDAMGNVTVEVFTPTGWEVCSAAGDRVAIDLVEGTIEGDDCEAIALLDDDEPPYTISYANGANVSGEYNLLIHGDIESIAHFENEGSPRAVPTIVNAELALSYRSASLTYETAIQVQPGESDG